MNLTSEEVISWFQKSCDEFGRLFVPEPRQDGIVESLIKYYERYHDAQLLLDSITYYVRHHTDDAILIYDFALESGKIREKALEDRKDRDEISALMKKTQERMEGYK